MLAGVLTNFLFLAPTGFSRGFPGLLFEFEVMFDFLGELFKLGQSLARGGRGRLTGGFHVLGDRASSRSRPAVFGDGSESCTV